MAYAMSPTDLMGDCDINGLMFQSYCLPEEVLVLILSFLDLDTVKECRLVCRLWKHTIETDIWRNKMKNEIYRTLNLLSQQQKLPWYAYFWIYKERPFERNLIKNNCGQDQLKHWNILSEGGDGWQVETLPYGSDEVPGGEEFGDIKSCFGTSYHSCSKEQTINLHSEGCIPEVMDQIQPCIEVSEWFAGRYDCGCIYELHVELLNEKKATVDEFEFRERINQWEGRQWHKVQHTFRNYGPGVRYIKFYHGGTDTQYWKGFYGSKMSGARVKLSLPSMTAS